MKGMKKITGGVDPVLWVLELTWIAIGIVGAVGVVAVSAYIGWPSYAGYSVAVLMWGYAIGTRGERRRRNRLENLKDQLSKRRGEVLMAAIEDRERVLEQRGCMMSSERLFELRRTKSLLMTAGTTGDGEAA